MDLSEVMNEIGQELETEAKKNERAKREIMAKLDRMAENQPVPTQQEYIAGLEAEIEREEGADPNSQRGQRLRLLKRILDIARNTDPQEWEAHRRRHNKKLGGENY